MASTLEALQFTEYSGARATCPGTVLSSDGQRQDGQSHVGGPARRTTVTRVLRLAVAALAVCAATTVSTTSVVPSTLDELVAGADTIFVSTVIDRRSERETTRNGRTIVTLVTFDVGQLLKGRLGPRTQLTFLGGTIGDETLHVADMPEFRIGDRDVLFVAPEQHAVSPLIGFFQGRFRIVRDGADGTDQIRTHDGQPFVSIADVGRPSTLLLRMPRPMTVSDFVAAVKRRVDARRPQ
jgi:hypothetical protein